MPGGFELTWRQDVDGKLIVTQGATAVRYRLSQPGPVVIDTGGNGLIEVEGRDFELANGLDVGHAQVTSRGGPLTVRNGFGAVVVRAGEPVTASARDAPAPLSTRPGFFMSAETE